MENKRKLLSVNNVMIALLGLLQSFLFLMPYISYTFYKPLQYTLDCTNEQIGLLLTAFGIATIIVTLPSGWLADRFNTKSLVVSGAALTGACVLVCAFSTSYKVYLVMWIIMAFSTNCLFWAAGMKATKMLGTDNSQGSAFGASYFVRKMGLTAIKAVGLAMVASALGELVGFKYFVILLGILLFIMAAILWKFLPGDASFYKEEGKTFEKANWHDTIESLKHKEIWIFAAIFFCIYSLTSSASYFTPYYSDVMGLNVALAGGIGVMMGPITAVCAPLLGIISDKLHSTLKTTIGVMAIAFVMLMTLVLSGTISLTLAIIINCVFAISIEALYGIGFSTLGEIGIDNKTAGMSIGIASIIAFSPDTFMYTMYGHWIDVYQNAGYKMVFTYQAVLAAVAIVLSLLLLYGLKKKRIT